MPRQSVTYSRSIAVMVVPMAPESPVISTPRGTPRPGDTSTSLSQLPGGQDMDGMVMESQGLIASRNASMVVVSLHVLEADAVATPAALIRPAAPAVASTAAASGRRRRRRSGRWSLLWFMVDLL